MAVIFWGELQAPCLETVPFTRDWPVSVPQDANVNSVQAASQTLESVCALLFDMRFLLIIEQQVPGTFI